MKKLLTLITLSTIMLMASGCPKDKAKAAASGVQKYAQTLESFQRAVVIAHSDGYVNDALDREFQQDFVKAAQAGEDLDKGIVAVSQGQSPQAYIDAAYAASDSLIADLNLIPDSKKRLELQVLFKASRDVLDNSLQLFLK